MSELKGRKNKKWSKEDRVRIVKRYFDEHIGIRTLSKEENMSKHILRHWILRYLKGGENELENKKKTGNKYAILNTGKCLTLEEKQKLIIAKQQIEIERLKKGYVVKEVGANKEFVTLKEMNMK